MKNHKICTWKIVVAATLFFLLSANANAASVTLRVSGIINNSNLSDVSAGDSFTADFVYDSDLGAGTIVYSALDEIDVQFVGSQYVGMAMVGARPFTSDGDTTVGVGNNIFLNGTIPFVPLPPGLSISLPPPDLYDGFGAITGSNDPVLDGDGNLISVVGIGVALLGNTDIYPSTAYTPITPNLAQTDYGLFVMPEYTEGVGITAGAVGTVTGITLVPIPAALPLFASALGIIGLSRRIRRLGLRI